MTRTFSDKEYWDLVQKLADQQYDTVDEEQEIEWIPSEPEIKERMVNARSDTTIDLTKTKKDKIKEALFKCTNIKVYNFLIRITHYHGEPDDKGVTLTLDFTLYEEIYKTPARAPCKMMLPCNLYKDNRFNTRPWAQYFDQATGSHCLNVPADTVVEIVRWIQVAKKLPAFL